MTADEQQRLSQTGQQIKDKIEARNTLRKDVDTLVERLEKITTLYKKDKRNTEELAALLNQLPQDDKIVRMFRELLDAENTLTCIQHRLGLTITEAQ